MIPLVAHADWSVAPAKRWMSIAIPRGREWHAEIAPVGTLPDLFARLRDRGAGAPIALGVDAPIGLPLAYGRRAVDFPAFLRAIDPESPFFKVCDIATDITPERPFYPNRSTAGLRRQDLLDRLGLHTGEQLLRECERRAGMQPAASPLFWTLGANQVGKGAICLWRDLLMPALHGDDPPSIWPFDGRLADLLRPGRIVIAETYPAGAMRQMHLAFKGSKRRQADRRAVACRLATLMRDLATEPDAALSAQLDDGFGAGADGEDRFDSLLGLLRMLQVICDPALDQLPTPAIHRWEGWILGRPVNIP